MLVPVRCIICSNPTGGVVEVEEYPNLSQANQTCDNCLGAQVNVGIIHEEDDTPIPHCDACGSVHIYVMTTNHFPARYMVEPGETPYILYEANNEELLTREARCRSCDARITDYEIDYE